VIQKLLNAKGIVVLLGICNILLGMLKFFMWGTSKSGSFWVDAENFVWIFMGIVWILIGIFKKWD
jgi:hypothetical protein